MGRDQTAALSHADRASVRNTARRASLESARSYASWYSSASEPSQPVASEKAISKEDLSKELKAFVGGYVTSRGKRLGPLPLFTDTGNNREYAQALMDYMYNAIDVSKKTQEGQSIVVYSQEGAGFGDIYFGAKIANMLKQALRHCDVYCVIKLNTPGSRLPDGLAAEYFTAPAGSSGSFIVTAIKQSETWDPGAAKPTVVLSGPAGILTDVNDLGLRGDTPLILAPEYGMREKKIPPSPAASWRIAPAGAAEDEYGLLLEQAFLSGEPLALETYNPALAARVEAGKYYFAYVNGDVKIVNESNVTAENNSHEHVLKFVRRYGEDSKKKNKPNTIVFAGGNTQKAKLEMAIQQVPDHWFEDLSSGAGKKPVPKGKQLYVYFQKMKHRQFLSALQNSHRIRFVTGDQSLSEALSLKDSFIMYEALEHKPKAYDDIMKHFGQLPNSLKLTDNTPSAQFLVDHGLDRDMTTAISDFQNDLNFQHRVVGAVKGYVLRSRMSGVESLDKEISNLAERGGSAKALLEKLKILTRTFNST